MKIWVLRDPSRCVGCRLCEVECSLQHEGVIWPSASRIRIFEHIHGFPTPYTCVQCDDYPCVVACPTVALRVAENGAVLVDEDKCVLCGSCVGACPGKVPRMIEGKKVVLICDLCGGTPACVDVCESMGFDALKVVRKPGGDIVKSYLANPFSVSEELAAKLSVVRR